MRGVLVTWLALFAFGTMAAAQMSAATPHRHMQVQLVSESATIAHGKPDNLAIVMTPEPGWHGYWLNPGEAGFAPTLKWTLPDKAMVGEIRYPVPEKLIVGGLVNHVFNGPHALLTTLTWPLNAIPVAPANIKLHIDYLVCTAEVCVPESADTEIALIAGDGKASAPSAARFDQWRAALPQPFDTISRPTSESPIHYAVSGKQLRIAIPYPASAPAPVDPWLFAITPGVIDYGAPQHFSRSADWLIIDMLAGAGAADFAKHAAQPEVRRDNRLQGVLALGNGRGLEIGAVIGAVPADGVPLSAAPDIKMSVITLLVVLGGALLGGLILNLMPCVFPIIGLKALSLARSGDADVRAVQRDALAYAAGVILTVLALGGLMLGLRAAGHAVGWAFQLQDPRIILLLLVLVMAITANLAGLFALRSVNAGDALTRQHGVAGSFWTGALAAFVATPCTGPFMAAALGAALVLPTLAALLIFAGLGLGLATPFLALAYIPALRTRLPKPGAWMRTLQQIMAIPMALTAAGLLWLLWRQAGSNGLVIGLVVAGLGVAALWLVGRDQRDGQKVGWRNFAQLAVPALVGISFLHNKVPAAGAEAGVLNAQPFSEQRLANALATKHGVFVYFTADWCLTCKVNEKAALETQAVADSFKAHNITVLRGDWTNGDPAITHFLSNKGRSGVPYYVYYRTRDGSPEELPQVLTIGTLTSLR